jgi:hypothetical protein
MDKYDSKKRQREMMEAIYMLPNPGGPSVLPRFRLTSLVEAKY